MRYSDTIQQISLAAMFLALAVAFSFAHFWVGNGQVFLVGVVIFLAPLFLKLPFSCIVGIASAVIADAINGWIIFTWISIIAYGVGVVIIWSSIFFFKNNWFYLFGIILTIFWIILIYFFLEWLSIGQDIAISDLIATSIQSAIIFPICFLLFLSFRKTNFIKQSYHKW